RGLDWAYVALDVPPERLEEAVHGLAALGFVRADITAPPQVAGARIVGSPLPSVNTLVGLEGHSTDAAILEGLPAERPVLIGDGGAAAAVRHARPDARVFSRRGEWPPDATGADLVVNATPVRDEVLVELGPGQTLVDLPYPRTATGDAAGAARG